MDKGQSEVTNKLRSAIKKKLAEICEVVDDELPEYIMILVANQRSKSHIQNDLCLFLGDNTSNFTNWLWDLLNSLNVGSKCSYSGQPKTDSNVLKQKDTEADEDAIVLDCDPDEQEKDFFSHEDSDSTLSKASAGGSIADVLDEDVKETPVLKCRQIKIPDDGKNKREQPVPNTKCLKVYSDKSAKELLSSKVVPVRKRHIDNSDAYDPSKPEYKDRLKYTAPRNYGGPAALQANKLLLKAVDDATKSILDGKNMEDFYKPTPIKVLSCKRFCSKIPGRTSAFLNIFPSEDEVKNEYSFRDNLVHDESSHRKDVVHSTFSPTQKLIKTEFPACKDMVYNAFPPRKVDVLKPFPAGKDMVHNAFPSRTDDIPKPFSLIKDAVKNPFLPREDIVHNTLPPRKDGVHNPFFTREDMEHNSFLPREDAIKIVSLPSQKDVYKPLPSRKDRDHNAFHPRKNAANIGYLPSEGTSFKSSKAQCEVIAEPDFNSDVSHSSGSSEQHYSNIFMAENCINRPISPQQNNRTICLRTVPLVSENSDFDVSNYTQRRSPEYFLPPAEEIRPKSPHFIVTLEGVKLSSFERKYDDNSIDSMDDDDDDDNILQEDLDTASPSKKLKVNERCKYWPACKNSDYCSYHHPTVPCKCFPDCKFGDKCLYIHPNCKFDSLCSRKECPFTHVSKRKLPLATAVGMVPAKRAKMRSVCKFFPKCTAKSCPFMHPKLCRFGTACRLPLCLYSHFPLPSRSQMKWQAVSF